MKACFFCKVDTPAILARNEFYRVDLQILRDLGFEVEIATRAGRIPSADVYVVWWWTWAFLPLIRAKFWRRPMVVLGTFDHVLPDGSLEMFPRRPRWHQALIRLVLRQADASVVCSRDQYAYLSRHFTVRGLAYSPHVVDVRHYQPGPDPREKFFLTFCWMTAGNARRKCIAETIRAMAILHPAYPDYRLIVGGEQKDGYPELLRLVQSLNAGDYIDFPGVVATETKIELMQKCAVYMQPTRGEGFGMAILEAMSCGAPVITSPVGAVPEVAGDTALMVAGADSQAIAAAMEQMLKNEGLRRDYGRRARQRAVELFSYERRRDDLQRILNQVMARA